MTGLFFLITFGVLAPMCCQAADAGWRNCYGSVMDAKMAGTEGYLVGWDSSFEIYSFAMYTRDDQDLLCFVLNGQMHPNGWTNGECHITYGDLFLDFDAPFDHKLVESNNLYAIQLALLVFPRL